MNMAEQFRLSASFRDMRFPNPLTPFTLFFFPFLSVFFSESCRFQPVEFYFPFPFLSFLFRRIPESAYPFRLRETDGKSVWSHFALVPLCVLLFVWLFVFS